MILQIRFVVTFTLLCDQTHNFHLLDHKIGVKNRKSESDYQHCFKTKATKGKHPAIQPTYLNIRQVSPPLIFADLKLLIIWRLSTASICLPGCLFLLCSPFGIHFLLCNVSCLVLRASVKSHPGLKALYMYTQRAQRFLQAFSSSIIYFLSPSTPD